MYLAGLVFLEALAFLREVVTRSANFVFGLIYGGRAQPLPPISNAVLLESAQSLARKIRTRELTSEEVVLAYIARIQEVNPVLNAMVDSRFEEAVREAQEVDRYLLTSDVTTEERLAREKPLFGVPYTIKENFQVKGLRQTAGLAARRNCVSTGDADAVVAMRRAGAILLGVTNLSELCTWWESRNNVYGQTNNPYDTSRVAGGSSGGEGSIIGAAGSVIGVGSDIGGSIRMPAFFNGIFGHKASPHMVSNGGQLPEATGETRNFLSTGPMCRYACDLIPLLKVLAGPDNTKILGLNEPVDIRSVKIYYMEDDGGFPLISNVSSELRDTLKKVLRYFHRAHGICAEKKCFPGMGRSLEIWTGCMTGCGAPTFCEEMAQKKGQVNIYTEFLKWLVGRSDHTFPAIALGFLEKVNVGRDRDNYAEIVTVCQKLQSDVQTVLGDDGVFLYPSFPTTAPYHYQPLVTPFDFAYPAVFNILGFPVTQCPLGLSRDRMPLGIQVVSALRNDRLSLAVACELEKAFGGWVSPSEIM